MKEVNQRKEKMHSETRTISQEISRLQASCVQMTTTLSKKEIEKQYLERKIQETAAEMAEFASRQTAYMNSVQTVEADDFKELTEFQQKYEELKKMGK